MRLLAETISATHPGIPSVILTVNRIDTFLSNTGSFSGSFIGTHTGSFTGSFTGSLLGTASWADSASQALTASFYQETDPIFVAKSASLATTGSNSFNGNQIITGSLTITGSSGSVIEVSSSNSALRITQLGTGEAIRVEDSDNPDITSFIVDSSGSVGIGQFGPTTFSAPLYPIHIIASGGVDARLVFDGKQVGNAAANANITIAADTSDKVASFDFFDRKGVGYATASLTYAGPTVRFLLDRSGSSAPLVTGGARNQFYIINGYPNSSTTFRGSSSLGTIATLNISPAGVVSAPVSFIAPTLQGNSLYPISDTNLIVGSRPGGVGGSNITFSTGNSGSSAFPHPRMVVSASGDVYISTGSLGVGTVTPRTKLHVISGSSSNASIQTSDTAVFESNANTYVSIYSPTASNTGVQFGSGGTGGDALGAYIRWNQGNNLMTLGTANDGDNINFVTGNETSSMYLKNNIGLGIGTTDPRYKLHVRNGEVTDSSTWGGSVGVFENSGSNTYVSILSHNNFNSAVGFGSNISRSAARLAWNHDSQNFSLATNIPSAFLTFGTGNETERMRITSGGLVGIGTTTPQYLLDVSGSARITSSLYLPGLTSSPEVNVVLINTSSGQLYYTASTAFGGGGGPSQPPFPYTGSAIITGSLVVTGSIESTLGFTGSLFGTASWADSASQALTASYVLSSSYASVNLQQVTDQGNITTNNILIGSSDSVGNPYLGFYDDENFTYGKLYFYDGEYYIEDYDGGIFVRFASGQVRIPGITNTSSFTAISSPYNGDFNRYIDLPGQDGTLVLSVNGTTANTSGSITLTTVPTASYINALNQNVVITGSISSLNTTASQETFSSASYVSGDIIQGTVVGVSQYDLAYLNTDGTWQHVDQTSDTSTKMLGIYLGGDQILIDGNISATTAGVGSPIGVDIMNPNQGLPVYIDSGSSYDFNTIIPTSNYIRTLGYVYYNNTINANNWILKFRPSTDWYKI
jgi:hypothetical protein